MSETEKIVKKDRANIVKLIEDNNEKYRGLVDRIRATMAFAENKKGEYLSRKQAIQLKRLEEERLAARIAAPQLSEDEVETPEPPQVETPQVIARVEEKKPHIEVYRPATGSTYSTQYAKPAERTVIPQQQPKPVGSTTATTTKTADDFKKKPLPLPEKKKPIDDKRKLSKKAKIQKGYEQNTGSVEYDEISGEIKKIRTRRSSSERRKTFAPTLIVIDHAVINTENITIKQLSEKIGKTGVEILKKLFELNIIRTINDTIDFDTAELVSAELGITLELQLVQTSEEKLYAFHSDEEDADHAESLTERPPIVTIMGHVDHGKTSVLDYIRSSHVASGEAGGITQHIGAYTTTLNGKTITFLDTPGHEAFTAMRARGANVTDIVVIVVAADDGIMPQTIEAINHAKAATNVSIIVAINKMDKPTANPDRILQQLSEHNLLVEDWGGTIPAIRVSAKTGQGINSLLENIILTAEIMELKANPDRSAKGTIVEAKLDRGKGPVATVLVQNGTLNVGDFIVAGTAIGRIRAMFDDKGRKITEAGPSIPASVLGLQDVPNAGDQILVVKDEKLSKQVVEERKNREKIEKLKTRKMTLEDVFSKIEEGKTKDLNLILKADVQGSEEAIKQSLLKLSNQEVRVSIVHSGVGAINESDVTLADTTNAIIIGFNIRPDNNAKSLAEKIGIEIKLYRVIYDAINDISLAIKGLLAPTYKETYLGRAEVRQIFKISSIGTIAGCMVKDGKITRNAQVRLLRDGVVITETTIASLKRMKDDAKEVATGYDCGIGLEKFNDIKEGDVIEAFIMEEVK